MLNQLRKKIDEIDSQLLTLFEQRMDVAQQVGAYKKERDLPVFVPEREKDVIENRTAAVQNPDYRRLAADFFTHLMGLSRRLQQTEVTPVPTPVLPDAHSCGAYLGRPGSYSEEALHRLLPDAKAVLSADSFSGVFGLLEAGTADIGILPVENTSTGAINDVLDLLSSHNLHIVAELTLPVRHVLAAPAGADLSGIKRVYSHPQGFLQCAEFLGTLGEIEKIPLASTADGAHFVAEAGDVTQAAIASRHAADLYGLTVLAENIQAADTNSTRFIAVTKEMEVSPTANTMSLAFTLPHTSGSLHKILSVFARYNLNLLYIESRPLPGRSFEYMFFVDCSGNLQGEAEQKALTELQGMVTSLQILGCYQSARGGQA